MNRVKLVLVGKTEKGWITEGVETYVKRLKHYTKFEIVVVSSKSAKIPDQQKSGEAEEIFKQITQGEYLILLDENGTQLSSEKFSAKIQKLGTQGIGNLTFVIGGAYGFSPEVYDRANYTLSLSSMTFTHQMVRVIFLEQLYRAFTILKGEKYHH